MEQVQAGVGLISGGTGVSIQVVLAVVGGAVSFGIGALVWIDKRIAKATDQLGAKMTAIDDRYRTDHLVLIERVTRLESAPYEWRNRQAAHSMNGQ